MPASQYRYALTLFLFAGFLTNCWATPGAVVVIEKHALGADLVEITMISPDAREEDLAARLGGISDGRRGTQLARDPLKGSMDKPLLTASFAVDGWLREDGTVKLAPLVSALCAPGPGRVNEIHVVISKFRPGADALVNFSSGDLQVSGTRLPEGFEYRIVSAEGRVLPPDRTPPPVIPTIRARPEPASMPWPILAVSALAAGALVYSAILYRRRLVRYGRPVGKSS